MKMSAFDDYSLVLLITVVYNLIKGGGSLIPYPKIKIGTTPGRRAQPTPDKSGFRLASPAGTSFPTYAKLR